MHLPTVYMTYSECLPTLLNPLAERTCFSQVPLVNTAAQAEEVVRAMTYPNAGGIRSCGPVRSGGLYGNEYMERANGEMAVICQIETKEALDNLEEICAVPGRVISDCHFRKTAT